MCRPFPFPSVFPSRLGAGHRRLPPPVLPPPRRLPRDPREVLKVTGAQGRELIARRHDADVCEEVRDPGADGVGGAWLHDLGSLSVEVQASASQPVGDRFVCSQNALQVLHTLWLVLEQRFVWCGGVVWWCSVVWWHVVACLSGLGQRVTVSKCGGEVGDKRRGAGKGVTTVRASGGRESVVGWGCGLGGGHAGRPRRAVAVGVWSVWGDGGGGRTPQGTKQER